jgi:diacylglycerol kinase (ATP)
MSSSSDDGKDDWTILHNTGAGMRGAVATTDDLRAATGRAGLSPGAVEPFDDCAALLARFDALLAGGARRVAVAAGDGTVAAAAARAAHRPGVTLGVVPVGGANNFARSAGVPTDLDAAFGALANGAARCVSLGHVRCADGSARFFTETAGVGLFADGLALYGGADEDAARTAYAVTRLVIGLHAVPLRLTLDGGEMLEEPSVLCMVANGPRFSDSLPIAPGAKLDDEVFDVVLFGDVRRRELLRYFNALRRGRHLGRDVEKTRRLRAGTVRIESADGAPLLVHADAAVVGTTPATFTLHPAALRVAIPAGKINRQGAKDAKGGGGGEKMLGAGY